MEKPGRALAVVRVRGQTGVRNDSEDTLKVLNLTRNCHATLVDDRPSYVGMLKKVQNQVAWGEVSKDTIALLLKNRGRVVGNKKFSEERLKKIGYESLDKLAEAIYNLNVDFRNLPDVKPLFRLHPPRKGFRRSIKKSYRSGGVTGYQGEAVNDIIRSMLQKKETKVRS